MIGSCHVEVRSDENFVAVHDIVDRIEREIHNDLNILMTIHMDPIAVDDAITNEMKELICDIIFKIDPKLSIHDFRVVHGETHTNLIFDLVVPYDCKYDDDELKQMIDESLEKEERNYYTVIVFDRDYNE